MFPLRFSVSCLAIICFPFAVHAACDPNYDWVCVPLASDVDCAGGQGNGPAYVAGPVKVVGSDHYRLDRDGDGYGCEPPGWTPQKGRPLS